MSDEQRADEVLALIRGRQQRGLSVGQLVEHLVGERGGGRSTARSALRPLLRQLVADGAVVLGRGKRYFAAEVTQLISGRLRLTQVGFGLVVPRDDGGEAIRIERSGLRGALDGDLVQVRLERARRRARVEGQREGVVVAVLERARATVVGRWAVSGGVATVRSVDRRPGVTVQVVGSMIEGEPAPGEWVVVSVDEVSRVGQARGRLVERLGATGEGGVEDRVVLRVFGLEEHFPPEVTAAALVAAASVADDLDRRDLRDRPVVTVDPDTARDFDDAVSARPGAGGAIEVEVHIADVGAYVAAGSVVDGEARERSTSVYLPGRVVPMLPERLSADLCSLRPDEDRLTFTVGFTVGSDGRLSRPWAAPSLTRSRRRLVYGQVAEWLALPGAWPDDTAPFAASLKLCAEAASRLVADRRARGSLDFDLAEAHLTLDASGEVVAVAPAPRTAAHRMIEELMVAANRTVAELLLAAGQPALHRVHDQPDPKRLADLAASLAELGVRVGRDDRPVTVRDLQEVLARAAGLATERFISTLVLRSLARAVYSPEPRGHFALASEAYCHFTSPIRRYPDLVVHRLLRRLLAERRPLAGAELEAAERELRALGEHCSAREQRAEAAERMAIQWRVVRFLADRVGEVFAGRVAGVTPFGLFVELEMLAVDGLVHVSDLADDYYHHDPVAHTLVGERSGRRFRLGDALEVRLLRVDEESFQLQLGVVGLRPDQHARGGSPAPPRPGRRVKPGRPVKQKRRR